MNSKLILITCFILFLIGCSENNDSTPTTQGDTPLNVSLDFKTAISEGNDVDTVKIKVLQNGSVLEEKEIKINNGIADAEFANLLAGDYTIEADAFFGTTKVASGNGDVSVIAGENTSVDLSLTFLTGTLTINIEYAIEQEAKFKLTFVSSWSADSHPTDFPGSPHFSGLIGATHNENINLWKVGELASTGIQSMAETGSKTALTAEVETAITDGNANAVLSAGGIGTSPGEVSFEFTANKNFPLMSLVSMLAPSPDWFIGTDSFDLIKNHRWISSKKIELKVYDSGTDDGATFITDDAVTNPPQPIAPLSSASTDFADGLPIIGHFQLEKVE